MTRNYGGAERPELCSHSMNNGKVDWTVVAANRTAERNYWFDKYNNAQRQLRSYRLLLACFWPVRKLCWGELRVDVKWRENWMKEYGKK